MSGATHKNTDNNTKAVKNRGKRLETRLKVLEERLKTLEGSAEAPAAEAAHLPDTTAGFVDDPLKAGVEGDEIVENFSGLDDFETAAEPVEEWESEGNENAKATETTQAPTTTTTTRPPFLPEGIRPLSEKELTACMALKDLHKPATIEEINRQLATTRFITESTKETLLLRIKGAVDKGVITFNPETKNFSLTTLTFIVA